MAARTALFDLDGTLTDPRPGIVGCMRFALDHLAAECPPDDVLATFIGPPLRGAFATLLRTSQAALIEEAMRLYRVRYADTGLYENRVYGGVPEMLGALGASAPAMFVATSKPTVYAARIVAHFGLDRHFARVYGAELDGRHDDKGELLAHLLATEQLAPGRAVMIGDRAADVTAARKNGLPAIGVLWGYGSRDELRSAGADLICESPAALPACLARLDAGAGR